jgi:hypothetical protein
MTDYGVGCALRWRADRKTARWGAGHPRGCRSTKPDARHILLLHDRRAGVDSTTVS